MHTVAVVLWEGRSFGHDLYVFTESRLAVEWARDRARDPEANRFGDLREREGDSLSQDHRRDGVVYVANYGESDTITVYVKTLNEKVL